MATNITNTAFHAEPSTSPVRYAAQRLDGAQRQQLAVDVLAGSSSVTELAERHQVSRKFLYRQADKGEQALSQAFSPPPPTEQKVLFYLPVTKAWLQQVVLGLVLLCHSSFRGVVEFFRDVLDCPVALGSVHNILMHAVVQARQLNAVEELSAVRAGGHDEIFQSGQPVLVGVDLDSTYCYLLAAEDRRDSETWAIHLWDLTAKGLQPDYTVADGGKGLRAGQALAWPELPCHGDVFHALQELGRLSQTLDNRAYTAINACDRLERKMHKAKHQRQGQRLSSALAHARERQTQAIEVADQVRTLAQWFQEDLLAFAGPDAATRQALYDFVLGALAQLEHAEPRIQPVRQRLANQRDDLLAFAHNLDRALAELAQRYAVPIGTVRAFWHWQNQPSPTHAYWQQGAELQRQLRGRFFPLHQKLEIVAEHLHRASSLVENLNSRLRNYFFLRRDVGPSYLELLRFFLNHRPYLRSAKSQRRGKTPAQLLTGQDHPHWLEMLGFQRFRRATA
jgi:transposase-like protein